MFWIWFLVVGVSSQAFPQSPSVGLYNKANAYYRIGDFESALRDYQKAVEIGSQNSNLYYNLGNAHFESGNIGGAILWYERAMLIAPRDADIVANLKFVNQIKKDRDPSSETSIIMRSVADIFRYPTIEELSLILSGCWVCMFIFLGWRLWSRDVNRKVDLCIVLFMCIFLFSGGWLFLRSYFSVEKEAGIIMDEMVVARSGPGLNQTEVFVVHEGSKVYLQREEGQWMLVRLRNGLGGWVPSVHVGRI